MTKKLRLRYKCFFPQRFNMFSLNVLEKRHTDLPRSELGAKLGDETSLTSEKREFLRTSINSILAQGVGEFIRPLISKDIKSKKDEYNQEIEKLTEKKIKKLIFNFFILNKSQLKSIIKKRSVIQMNEIICMCTYLFLTKNLNSFFTDTLKDLPKKEFTNPGLDEKKNALKLALDHDSTCSNCRFIF